MKLQALPDNRPAEGVNRINFHSPTCPPAFVALRDRIVSHLRENHEGLEDLLMEGGSQLEFYLVHKFVRDHLKLLRHLLIFFSLSLLSYKPSIHRSPHTLFFYHSLAHAKIAGGYFDHHVDSHPSDSPTQRTYNINVLLSQSSEYSGGELKIGDELANVSRGDLYTYPAFYPHAVTEITKGVRFTLILAVKATKSSQEWSRWWDEQETKITLLCQKSTNAGIAILLSTFLERRGKLDQADQARWRAYVLSGQAKEYADYFRRQNDHRNVMGIKAAMERAGEL